MLTNRQKRAIAALMETNTNRDAARAAGVSESTIQRYLTLPEFRDEYTRLTNEMVKNVLISAEKSLDMAFRTMVDVCRNTEENGQTRISAARSIIEYTLRMKEIVEIDERLERLEEYAAEDRNTY